MEKRSIFLMYLISGLKISNDPTNLGIYNMLNKILNYYKDDLK